MTKALWALVLCALVVVGGLGACGESSAENPGSTSSSLTSTTFDRAGEEQAVIDAYLAELDAFYAASNPPDPDHPALAETATGPLLKSLRERLEDMRSKGLAGRKGDSTTNNPIVTRLARNAAVIEDCVTDADVQFEIASGTVVNDEVVYFRATARLIKERGTWLVHERSVEHLEAPCGE